LAQPHNHLPIVHGVDRDTPRTVREAIALIEDRAHEPISVHDVAAAVGVSVRALQAGFRRTADTSPTAYLRDVRLRRIHAALRAADPSASSVTRVASDWQMFHAGRFAAQYLARFGEKPSETLYRSRVSRR
jgi:transcriptional regulator GlxA family with amidase domain